MLTCHLGLSCLGLQKHLSCGDLCMQQKIPSVLQSCVCSGCRGLQLLQESVPDPVG